MNKVFLYFIAMVIYPLSLSASDDLENLSIENLDLGNAEEYTDSFAKSEPESRSIATSQPEPELTIDSLLDDEAPVTDVPGQSDQPVVDVPSFDTAAGIDTSAFDELPIKQSEVKSVTHLFWNAKSIQDQVKKSIPSQYQGQFSPHGAKACAVQAVTKTEGSADTCELNEDPGRMAKFIYKLSVSCGFGHYQVSICSHRENQLLNQLKVESPEKVVSDDNPFDLDSTM